MSADSATHKSSGLDTAMLLLSLVVLGAAIYGFYYFEGSYNVLIRVGGLLACSAVSILIAFQTDFGRSAWAAIQGSRIELRRVVWPSRKETVQATLMISLVVLVLAVFLWGLDAILLWAMRWLTGQAGG